MFGIKIQNLNLFFTKQKSLFAIVIITMVGTLSYCDQKEKVYKSPRIRKISKVESPKYNGAYKLSDSIKFTFSLKKDTVSIDSFSVYYNNSVLLKSNKSSGNVVLNQTGEKNLRVSLFLNNGKKEQHNQRITVYSNTKPAVYSYHVINTFTHDPDAYTQGLIFENGVFYESTGQFGTSTLRKVEVLSGKVLQKINLDDQYFGEGITILGDEIFMITYKSLKGFVFKKTTFELLRSFEINSIMSEGWGITSIGDSLVMSDGSENLYYLDPTTLTEISRIQVYDEFKPIKLLNELEFINGEIYANIYQSDEIVIIDPKTGQVTGKLDLTGIFNANNYNRRLDVLNGIAYNSSNEHLYVTGKWWPKLFEIQIAKSTLNQ